MANYNNERRPRINSSSERYQGNGRNFQNHQSGYVFSETSAESFFANQLRFKQEWIAHEVDAEFVVFAEKAGEYMKERGLTNSKIRSVYGEIKRIQMGEWERNKAAFYLLKPKMAYAVGREKQNSGESKVQGLLLFQRIFNECFSLVNSEATYKNFCNMIEGVLAYHKAFGGKD